MTQRVLASKERQQQNHKKMVRSFIKRCHQNKCYENTPTHFRLRGLKLFNVFATPSRSVHYLSLSNQGLFEWSPQKYYTCHQWETPVRTAGARIRKVSGTVLYTWYYTSLFVFFYPGSPGSLAPVRLSSEYGWLAHRTLRRIYRRYGWSSSSLFVCSIIDSRGFTQVMKVSAHISSVRVFFAL